MNADSILNRYWNNTLPINPQKIAQAMGVGLLPDNNMRSSDYCHLGYKKRRPTIQYNAHSSHNLKRFIIAHALGHYIQGEWQTVDIRGNFSSLIRNPIEIRANQFATSLLIPEYQIQVAIERRDITDIARLAKLFDVSGVAMEYQLNQVGLL